MAIKYIKATSIRELITAIHTMDIEYVREYGISLALPVLDKKTRKIVIHELKKLGIYHKVKMFETTNTKKLYEKALDEYNLWQKTVS